MKYKKVLLPPEPYYSGRVTRYPDRKVAFESGLRWHGSYEISYNKKVGKDLTSLIVNYSQCGRCLCS